MSEDLSLEVRKSTLLGFGFGLLAGFAQRSDLPSDVVDKCKKASEEYLKFADAEETCLCQIPLMRPPSLKCSVCDRRIVSKKELLRVDEKSYWIEQPVADYITKLESAVKANLGMILGGSWQPLSEKPAEQVPVLIYFYNSEKK